MKTLSIPVFHRHVAFAVVAAVLVLITAKPPSAPPDRLSLMPVPTMTIPVRPAPSDRPANELPFTVEDVVEFLSSNFEIEPVESAPDYAKFIYAEEPGGSGREIMRVVVNARGDQLRVAFAFREMNVIHYVSEFIECPLFTRAESDELYAILYSSRGWRWHQLQRFKARATLADARGEVEAAFEFAP